MLVLVFFHMLVLESQIDKMQAWEREFQQMTKTLSCCLFAIVTQINFASLRKTAMREKKKEEKSLVLEMHWASTAVHPSSISHGDLKCHDA